MCKISVIIPVYNVEKYIERCLESVCSQTMQDFEVIIINDGSKENEELIIDKYLAQNSNIYYCKKANGGQASARNLGIEKANGRYVLFLDSDDYLEQDALETMYTATEDEKVDIVLCDGYFVYEKGEKKYFKTNIFYTKDKAKNYLINACSPCFKLVRKTILEHSESRFLENRIYEDLASVGTYLLHSDEIVYIEKPLYNYTVRKGSTMNKVMFDKKMEDIFFALYNLKNIFTNKQKYHKYKEEFEFIYIMRLLHDASLRFFEFPEGRENNKRIADIMKKEYPKWCHNRYYRKMSLKYKIICELFAREKYKILSMILERGD